MNATTKTEIYARGELLYDALDRKYVRYVRTESDGLISVCDRNTLEELPDLRHPTQVKLAK